MKQNKAERHLNVHALLADLSACGVRRDLEWGRRIHARAVRNGNDRKVHVAVALLRMFAKCGSMRDAHDLFNSIEQPSVMIWTALLLGYVENGQGLVTLDLFSRMKSHGPEPNYVTYLAALKACTSLVSKDAKQKAECLKWGKQIHLEIGGCLDPRLQSTLIGMYAKCGEMVEAKQVFDGLEHRDVVSWTSLIKGYAENGEGLIALDLYTKMKAQGCAPDSVTYVAVLKACTFLALKAKGCERLQCLQRGRLIHCEIGSQPNYYVQNTLIDMYGKCGSMYDAKLVFDAMSLRDALPWNALILGYVDNGEPLLALDLFLKMKENGFVPDSITYMAALKACTSLALKENSRGTAECLQRGKGIHLEIGCHLNLRLQNTLIDMYCKCGSMVDAKEVFDSIRNPDVVSWNALALGYAENGGGLMALGLFSRMKAHGCIPDSISYVAVLKACGSVALKEDANGRAKCLEFGKQIHAEIGCHLNVYVQNALIDMYAKCGNMFYAKQVFDNIRHRDVVSWTGLLLGYAENGEGVLALELFLKMKEHGCTPDCITYVAVLKACGLLGALEFGRKVHKDITREFNIAVVTCLVDFYAKCGSLPEAQEVFDLHYNTRDVATWSALLSGYSRFGETSAVFRLFESMQDAEIKPTSVTFLCLLTCCSHAGLVVKARECFESMCNRYFVSPTVEHYTCMIDVLGRANKLDDVLVLLRGMPCSPDVVTWTAILCACRKWKNVEMGKLAYQSWVSLDESNAAPYVLMGHIYSSRGMWEAQEALSGVRKRSQAWVLPEQTCWTNRMGEVHKFPAGESEQPDVSEEVALLGESMKQHGHLADSLSLTVDAKREEQLCHHSERLAIVYALKNTRPGETVRVVKNLKVCDDCHKVISLISKVKKRIILVRDAIRFHAFSDGKCSCNDYW